MKRVRDAGVRGTSRVEVKRTSDQTREVLRLSWGKQAFPGEERGWAGRGRSRVEGFHTPSRNPLVS